MPRGGIFHAGEAAAAGGDLSHHCRRHCYGAAVPPGTAGGEAGLCAQKHHLGLRHRLVFSAGAAQRSGNRSAGGRDRTGRFPHLPALIPGSAEETVCKGVFS